MHLPLQLKNCNLILEDILDLFRKCMLMETKLIDNYLDYFYFANIRGIIQTMLITDRTHSAFRV